ncbi:ribonuclease H-like domain-containing protein [Tanacetum coccineum]
MIMYVSESDVALRERVDTPTLPNIYTLAAVSRLPPDTIDLEAAAMYLVVGEKLSDVYLEIAASYSMAGSEDDIPPPPPPPPSQTPTQQTSHTVSTIKLPILNKGEYDIWVLPPKTAEEILARERERKARTTLLMAYHLAKNFIKLNDAKKKIWEAYQNLEIWWNMIESKKMQKRLTEDANQKFLRSLPSAWSQVSLILRTKPGVDSLSFDDLYNNLRVFESDVKGSTASSSSTQNVAFVSENTSSTNDVSTAYGVSNSFDLEQLDEFDLEEMDLKWQIHRESKILGGEMLGHWELKDNENGWRLDTEICKGDECSSPSNDRIYIPSGPDTEIDDSRFTYGPKQSKPSESDARSSDFTTCESKFVKKLHESMHEPVHCTVPTNAARKVNTVKPIVNNARPKAGFHKTLSPFRKPFNRTTALRTNFSYQKVNTAEDYPQRALQNKGIVDSGCSRHMTGNKAYLAEYQDFNGGPVAFGGSKGYITGKGKIKTGKLDFEDVCFVKELQHFNLFSMSQMCDKKNKVLFTDFECLVLSLEFKLPDENQVLLRIPRQNNMYSFNLENIVPSGGLACLIAKATIDESNKWHRRLGHVNFKNLNKLVKGNLVRGLPLKKFQNDHTCVACQKGKQQKASCKAKSVIPLIWS